jgi:hypothetical protein
MELKNDLNRKRICRTLSFKVRHGSQGTTTSYKLHLDALRKHEAWSSPLPVPVQCMRMDRRQNGMVWALFIWLRDSRRAFVNTVLNILSGCTTGGPFRSAKLHGVSYFYFFQCSFVQKLIRREHFWLQFS